MCIGAKKAHEGYISVNLVPLGKSFLAPYPFYSAGQERIPKTA